LDETTKSPVQFVHDARDKSQIKATGHGPEARAGSGDGVKLRFICRHGRHGHLTVSHLNDLRV
jgi:hypothetical protein